MKDNMKNRNPDPEIFELSCGETYTSFFGGIAEKRIKLISVKPVYEPYFYRNVWYKIFQKADVNIEIDGVVVSMICAPYQLPVSFWGLNIIADLIKGIEGGRLPVGLTKDVRFSAKINIFPWFDPGRFTFPIHDYRWRASNYQHTWNGFVHISSIDGKGYVYYHRGEDFGAVPDRHDFGAMSDSKVTALPPSEGDGASNGITLHDYSLAYRYAHANSSSFRNDLFKGDTLRQGERVAKTGNTWAGKGTEDAHLHIGISKLGSNEYINSYPIIVQAYRNEFPGEILAVAGGFRFCMENELLEFDASNTIIPEGGGIPIYTWNFSEGGSAEGIKVKKKYHSKGTYTEELIVTDSLGRTGRDYVMVSVFEDRGCDVPWAYISYYPVRGIKAGESVEFSCSYRNMENVIIDFGDGTISACNKKCMHSYNASGEYVVAIRGESTGGGPGHFKVCVMVE